MLTWFKVRPEIEVYVPGSVRPGAPFHARVVLRCADAVPVQGVDVEVVGAFISVGDAEVQDRFFRAVARLRGEGELDAGEHTFHAQIEVPAGSPPTYAGQRLRVEYTLKVAVDIPWWPDARARFHLQVVDVGHDRPALSPLYASRLAEPPGSAPHLEISLRSDVVRPGGDLEGAIALVHGGGRPIAGLSAALIAAERSPRVGGVALSEVCRWTLVGAEAAADAAPRPLRIRLPVDLTSGFEHGEYGLAWLLQVRLALSWMRDLEVKIPIKVNRGELVGDGERRAAPAVGSERQALLWREVARETGLQEQSGALVGRVGGVSLQIARERRPRGGEVVVAAIDAPSLAIGLTLADAGDERAAPALRSRDMSQATWLEGQLQAARGELRWAAASDDELRLEVRDAGRDARGLVAFARAVLAVARRLDEVRDQLPPPRALADRRPRWAEAARRLGARLRPGDLALFGGGEGFTFSVIHEWDRRGEVLRTHLELRPEVAIDERHHLRWHNQGGEAPESELPLGALCEGAWQLEIERAAIRIVIVGDVDPVAEIGRIQALQGLAGRLAGRLGLYR
ncbi:MAG: hypothetical protein R3B09_01895 [Nannocystaceae bacterium]